MVFVANEFEKDMTREGIVICFCDVSLRVFHFIQNEKENFVTRRRTKNSHMWCRGAKKSIILFHAYTCGFDQTIKLLFFVLSLSFCDEYTTFRRRRRRRTKRQIRRIRSSSNEEFRPRPPRLSRPPLKLSSRRLEENVFPFY